MSSNDAGVAVSEKEDVANAHAIDADAVKAQDANGAGGPLKGRTAFNVSLVAAAVAFVAAVLFGVLWWSAASGDQAEISSARDEASAAAQGAIAAFTQFDYRQPEEYANSQIAVSTDEWAKQIEPNKKRLSEVIAKSKQVATSKILDIAVDELNAHEGKASVIASLEATVTRGEENATKRIRIQVDMTRVDGVWKVAGIDQVSVVPPGA